MAKSYAHSAAFSKLKDITETISKNLTSLEYLQTLDMFLWRALEPIHAECPALFNNYMAKVVAHQSLKASTKFTSDDRTKLPVHMFNMITTQDPKKAHEHAKAMHINRGLLFGFLVLFLRRMDRYERLHSTFDNVDPIVRNSEIYQIERSIGLRQRGALYSAIQQVRFWYERARAFKEMIIEKYTRLALMQARSTYKDFNHYTDLDDVVQIYLVVVSRAIDRCDARQGVLTTFITNWFKSGRSEVANLSKGQTDQSYEALVEEMGDSASDLLGFAMPDTQSETVEHVAFTAKTMDIHGYIRSILHIPEFATRSQKEVLELFALEETA
jgi:hypothetical protein